MKKLILSTVALLICAPALMAASEPLKAKALILANAYKDSVVYVSAVVELEISANDSPAKKEERKIEVLATVLTADGTVVAPLSTLDLASNIDGRTMNSPQGPMKISAKGTTKEVKILTADGTEVPAKMAFKDPDLDLAFIRPEKPDGAKFTPIPTANAATMGLLDDVIILGRLGKELNREPVAYTSELIALITKPRNFGKLSAPALGMPVFNQDGKFIGLGINRMSAKGSESDNQGPPASNVLLPAADLLESAAQVK